MPAKINNWQEPFLEALLEVGKIGLACKKCGISTGLLYPYWSSNPDFAEKVKLIKETARFEINKKRITRKCPKCGIEKSVERFEKSSYTGYGLNPYCKTCRSIQRKEKPFPSESSTVTRFNGIKRNYNLSRDAYEKMYNSQRGECNICHDKILICSSKRIDSACVDHDHVTGKVRSLLCNRCNAGLGMFRDNPTFLRAATEYMEYHKNGQEVRPSSQ